ncbi:hypothetical protein [Roseobacter weihaiensis]|uniref:hypothetical protein n=1 Tax=Roseobacter weihaiensis TaxID=2763262 RepID=UPI001D09BAD1|nr:hypothetical protein [Roseobacter sp. H9]
MPFLDATTTGWIIPPAAPLRIEISDGGNTVETGRDFDRPLASNHRMHQVKGNPKGRHPPCRFHNFRTIVTPPGWSCLFAAPLNRPNGIFEIVAGVVDTGTYRAPIHFHFFATGPDGLHILQKRVPISKVIPLQGSNTVIEVDMRAETPTETLGQSDT